MKKNYTQPSLAATSIQTMFLMQFASSNNVITGDPIYGGGDPNDAI